MMLSVVLMFVVLVITGYMCYKQKKNGGNVTNTNGSVVQCDHETQIEMGETRIEMNNGQNVGVKTPLLGNGVAHATDGADTNNGVTMRGGRSASRDSQKDRISTDTANHYEQLPEYNDQLHDEAEQAYRVRYSAGSSTGDSSAPAVAPAALQPPTGAVQADVHRTAADNDNESETKSHGGIVTSASAHSISGVDAIPIQPRPLGQRAGGDDDLQSCDMHADHANSVSSSPESSLRQSTTPKSVTSTQHRAHNAIGHDTSQMDQSTSDSK